MENYYGYTDQDPIIENETEETAIVETHPFEHIIPQIREVEECLELVYPGMWYITQEESQLSVPGVSILIKLPDFEIENGYTSHTITGYLHNLFIYIDDEGAFRLYLAGTRLKATTAEINSGYKHSHLGTSNTSGFFQLSWNGFCTPESFKLQQIELRREFSKESFNMLLLLMDSMVRHESEAGGPYIRISNITSNSSRNNVLDINRVLTLSHYEIIRQEILQKKPNYPVIFDNGYIVENITDEEVTELLSLYSNNSTFFPYYNPTDDNYYTVSTTHSNSYSNHVPRSIIFKDERINFEVIGSGVTELQKVVNPHLKNIIKNIYETEINKNQAKSYLIRRYAAFSNQ